MDTNQKIEVLKQAVAMASTVLAHRTNISAITYRAGGGDKADTGTAVVDHFFQHFCDLVRAE